MFPPAIPFHIDGTIEHFFDGRSVVMKAGGAETAVVLCEDPAPRKRDPGAFVDCYFCGKRADGLTSNDLPSCAGCRALPQRKR